MTVSRLFSLLSIVCLLASLPVARLAVVFAAPSEDLLGFGALGVAIVAMVIALTSGALLALIGLYRKEAPRWLAFFGLFVNAGVLTWLVVALRA